MNDVAKASLYRELGFAPPYDSLDAALADAGLSSARKQRIAESKKDAVREVLEAQFLRVCSRGECVRLAPADRSGRAHTGAVSQETCDLCGGSVNLVAVEEMVAALTAAGLRRLCVVGGSPVTRGELERLAAGRLELRLIDGQKARTRRQAEDDVAWADRVVIWGGTQLGHKVSELYGGPKVVQMHGRGDSSVAREATRSAARGRR
ncbi:MAG: hypothetical protein AB7T37_12630 [Dehalococcoidia bacterium]